MRLFAMLALMASLLIYGLSYVDTLTDRAAALDPVALETLLRNGR